MFIRKDGKVAEGKGKYEKQLTIEREFCLNRCPHPKASDCRWQVKQCMKLAKRSVSA